MLKTYIKNTIGILLIATAGFACKSLGEPHTIKSRDGKSEITVPANMSESPSLSKDAQITAANRSNELYLFVLTNKKSSYGDQTLDEHTDVLRNALLKELTSADASSPENVTINGREARRYRITGTRDGIKLAYFMTVIDSANDFHHIWSWTEGSRAAENGPILYQIADSFRITE
jgi:hypothetical protein